MYREGGVPAFYRGVLARVLTHAPAVAISWTSYETVKHLLERAYPPCPSRAQLPTKPFYVVFKLAPANFHYFPHRFSSILYCTI